MPILISIVAPAHNEERLIRSFMADIHRYLKKSGMTFEILIMENGSNDKTKSLVLKESQKISHIKLISINKPSYGISLKKGIAQSKGKYIIIFNIDFYDLRLIDLCKVDMLGADLIIGSKLSPWSVDQRPVARKIISKSFNLVLKLLFGYRGTDTHGVKLIRGAIIGKLLAKSNTTSGIADTEIVIRMQRAGAKIFEIPEKVEEVRPPRFKGRGLRTIKDIFDLTKSLWLNP